MAAYGSPEVNTLFNRIGRGVILPTPDRGFAQTWDVEKSFEDPEAQIRKELGDAARLERARQ